MVRAFKHILSTKKSTSKKMFDSNPGRQAQSPAIVDNGSSTDGELSISDDRVLEKSHCKTNSGENEEKGIATRSPRDRIIPSDMELMKEKFAKLLLGEDMSGGGKGVSSALAISNAITNLAASIFGEITKLEPVAPDRKARWRKEIDWVLSVTDHIVEFVPSQTNNNGTNMEIMVTRQRSDLLANIPALRKLDAMLLDVLQKSENQTEFWYVKRDADDAEARQDDKWWLPTAKVPPNGLSEESRKMLQSQKDSVTQVLKAAMAINAQVLSEMEIPESYIETLPKNGRASLGDTIYKSITVELFSPEQFLSTMDLSTEHKVLDLKNRIEASIVIWKRKMHQKDGKTYWGSTVSLEKRELFEERAETVLLILKQRFPGISQSSLDICKIQYNKDVGQSILESYSRIIETLANTVMCRIKEVLHADAAAQWTSLSSSDHEEQSSTITGSPASAITTPAPEQENNTETPNSVPTLSDFMGWSVEQGDNEMEKDGEETESFFKGDNDKKMCKPVVTSRKSSYLEKVKNPGGLRSPTARH